MEGLGSGMVVREMEISSHNLGCLGNPGGEWGVVDSLADGDVIEEESLGDGVANEELEEDFCMAGELSSTELMKHSGEVSGLKINCTQRSFSGTLSCRALMDLFKHCCHFCGHYFANKISLR